MKPSKISSECYSYWYYHWVHNHELFHLAPKLKEAGYEPLKLKEAGYGAEELMHAGFSAKTLFEEAAFDGKELREGGAIGWAMRQARFSVTELKNQASRSTPVPTWPSARTSGYMLEDMKCYYAKTLKQEGLYTVKQFKEEGFTAKHLMFAGFTAPEVRALVDPLTRAHLSPPLLSLIHI